MILRRRFSIKPTFDLAVIGGGPGGYVAAIKASQLGMKTVCIDNRAKLGGTCLNIGCIPSKFLLKVAQKYTALLNASRFGMACDNPSFDWTEIQQTKQGTVDKLAKGIDGLFAKNKVVRITGNVSFKDLETLVVHQEEGSEEEVRANNYVIATGSQPTPLTNVPIDERTFFTSAGILSLASVPKRLTVIGAGVIGLELGSVFRALGSEVTFIEHSATVLPGMDADVIKEYQKYMIKEGYKFVFNSKVIDGAVASATGEAVVQLEDRTTKQQTVVIGDVCLVATGRRPNTQGLHLDNVGIKLDESGRIKVDHRFYTGVGNIYAIGDVIEGPMLAHKAEEEGMAVAEYLAGHHFTINYDAIPSVVYTEPEIAFVGKTQAQLEKLGIPFKVGTFPMMANSRSRTALEDKPGLVKILAHRDTDRILGGHIISANAGEMIMELALAMSQKGSAEDIAAFSHAHPTLSEGIKEAAMAIVSKAIHV
jgi:dihydrolipoamide dehydrogenase